MYNVFDTYEDALLAAILDTMQFMRDYNDNNGYTHKMFTSIDKFNELNNLYQEYLDGNKTDAEVLEIYTQNIHIKGKWDAIQETLDNKFVYEVYENSLYSYNTIKNPSLPEE